MTIGTCFFAETIFNNVSITRWALEYSCDLHWRCWSVSLVLVNSNLSCAKCRYESLIDSWENKLGNIQTLISAINLASSPPLEIPLLISEYIIRIRFSLDLWSQIRHRNVVEHLHLRSLNPSILLVFNHEMSRLPSLALQLDRFPILFPAP